MSKKPSQCQVGGDHYKSFAIQPGEFSQKNRLNFCESNIIKYACRHKLKGGADDVRKIIHYAKLILEWEYGEVPAAEACPVPVTSDLADTGEYKLPPPINGLQWVEEKQLTAPQ